MRIKPGLSWCFGMLTAVLVLASSASAPLAQSLQQRLEITQNVNAGKVGVMSGGANGTYARMSQDLAQVLNQDLNLENQLRIVPTLGLGSVQNLIDLIYLEGVDVAFVQSDVLRAAREDGLADRLLGQEIAEDRIGYIISLYDEEMHLLAGPSITSINDLDGKKVAVGTKNSGSALSASLIFGFKGIRIEPVELAGDPAIAALQRNEVAAVFMVVGKPARLFQTLDTNGRDGVHFLSLQIPKGLEDTYREAQLVNSDYPNLIPETRPTETIAVSSVLAAYKFDPGQSRYLRLERFVEALFAAMPRLRQPGRGYHQKWQQVDINAEVAGWERFAPAVEHALQR